MLYDLVKKQVTDWASAEAEGTKWGCQASFEVPTAFRPSNLQATVRTAIAATQASLLDPPTHLLLSAHRTSRASEPAFRQRSMIMARNSMSVWRGVFGMRCSICSAQHSRTYSLHQHPHVSRGILMCSSVLAPILQHFRAI